MTARYRHSRQRRLGHTHTLTKATVAATACNWGIDIISSRARQTAFESTDTMAMQLDLCVCFALVDLNSLDNTQKLQSHDALALLLSAVHVGYMQKSAVSFGRTVSTAREPGR